MPRTRAIRILVFTVCAAGIAGMIVTSATNHNGAAITFGLVTAVAVICQMVATTVVDEATGAPGAPIAGPWSTTARPTPTVSTTAQPTVSTTAQPALSAAEQEAADLEARIGALVLDGSDEAAVRDLVRRAVRLGRRSTPATPPDS